MSLAPITGDGGKLAAQAADQTQKTTPVQEFQGILKNGLNTIKEDMDSIFEEASALYQIPSKLLRAVAKAESGFNPRAVSKAGAMGVMQLMPGTARSLGVSDPYNARQNILGGAKYLKQNLNRFGGDVSLALAAYNAGPGSVTKYGGIPPYKETQNYVKKIMADYTGKKYDPGRTYGEYRDGWENIRQYSSEQPYRKWPYSRQSFRQLCGKCRSVRRWQPWYTSGSRKGREPFRGRLV